MRTALIPWMAAASLVGLAFAGPALATSGSGQQNPDMLVTIDFHSTNANPDVATGSDTWAADETITNETDHTITVTVVEKLKAPTSELARFTTKKVSIDSGAVATFHRDWGAVAGLPPARYRATITANDGAGRSRAVGRVTVVSG